MVLNNCISEKSATENIFNKLFGYQSLILMFSYHGRGANGEMNENSSTARNATERLRG